MIKSILTTIYNYFSPDEVVGAMLTGSCVEQKETNFSDIDIVIISNLAGRQTHENIIVKTKIYQFIIFSKNKSLLWSNNNSLINI
jgi:hypothetical protein